MPLIPLLPMHQKAIARDLACAIKMPVHQTLPHQSNHTFANRKFGAGGLSDGVTRLIDQLQEPKSHKWLGYCGETAEGELVEKANVKPQDLDALSTWVSWRITIHISKYSESPIEIALYMRGDEIQGRFASNHQQRMIDAVYWTRSCLALQDYSLEPKKKPREIEIREALRAEYECQIQSLEQRLAEQREPLRCFLSYRFNNKADDFVAASVQQFLGRV